MIRAGAVSRSPQTETKPEHPAPQCFSRSKPQVNNHPLESISPPLLSARKNVLYPSHPITIPNSSPSRALQPVLPHPRSASRARNMLSLSPFSAHPRRKVGRLNPRGHGPIIPSPAARCCTPRLQRSHRNPTRTARDRGPCEIHWPRALLPSPQPGAYFSFMLAGHAAPRISGRPLPACR